MKVLVTGGMGYIGSHVVDELVERGHGCDVIDASITLENHDFVTERCENLWNYEVQNIDDFMPWKWSYDAIIHLAALISVEQSTREPATYWNNNLGSLMALSRVKTDHLIFASTGAAFDPTSPYAQTKVACERYIQDVATAEHRWFGGQTTFRFYNVSGLKEGIQPTGQPTHLIRLAAMAAKGLRDGLTVYGSDYDTVDGTAVRDYIDVRDIAASIVNACEAGPANTPYECLGTGRGSSVLEVVQSMRDVSGAPISVTMAHRRPGDAATTICPSQYKYISQRYNLNDMCLSAYLQA